MRATAALLAASALTLGLAACGGDDSSSSSTATSAAAVSSSAAATTAAASTTAAPSTAAPTTVAATTTTAPPKGVGPAAVPQAPDGDAFYQPPSPLPSAAPGTLIWATTLTSTVTGGTGYKILYHSRSVKDADIAVSGLLWLPDKPNADTPVLSYAHGTTGLADQCAPSKDDGKDEAATVAAPFLQKGYIVVATDYEGLGTPGVHPYVVGQSEGRSVLDAIRAARAFTVSRGKSVVWGHSQGGGSALFAAELAPTYAPDANVIGSVAGAPAVELKLLATALRTSPFFGYIFQAAAGFKAAYPEIDLTAVATDKGLAEVKVAENTCGDVHDDVRGKNADDYLKTDPASVEPFATLLEDNTPGNVPTTVPIFVYHGEADEQIPVVGSQLFLQRACKKGGFTILRKTYPGASHVGVIAMAANDIQGWIADRFAGTPAPTTPCPSA